MINKKETKRAYAGIVRHSLFECNRRNYNQNDCKRIFSATSSKINKISVKKDNSELLKECETND